MWVGVCSIGDIKTTEPTVRITYSTPNWRAIKRNRAWAKRAIGNWRSLIYHSY